MFITASFGKTLWVAWCSDEPLRGPDAVREPARDVWFEFGRSAAEAELRLKASLPGVCSWVRCEVPQRQI